MAQYTRLAKSRGVCVAARVNEGATMNRKYSTFPVTAESLRGCRFFDDQDEQIRAKIAKLCEGRTYKAGAEIIRHQGTESEVFFIISGRVRANTHTLDGKVVTFQGLRSDEMFGEVSALDGYPRSTDVVAAIETKVLVSSGRLQPAEDETSEEFAERVARLKADVLRRALAAIDEEREKEEEPSPADTAEEPHSP